MTSLERRHEVRYQRRKAAREAKKKELYSQYDVLENISSFNSLFKANKRSTRNVIWKASVQRYQMNLLRNLNQAHKGLQSGSNITKGFVEFDTVERGKKRHIRSVHFSERVVQRSTCDNALVPMLTKSLIYDNGACLQGRGIDWALNRMDVHLHQFYRANGFSNDGYVIRFDFKGYFDSVRHDICFQIYERSFSDKRIVKLVKNFVYPFGFPFASEKRKKRKKDYLPEDYSGLSLGLGSQISQITAVSYPNALDHYIKQTLRVKWYGRYMDDGYLLFKTRDEAIETMNLICEFCESLGITVNKKKTQISKINKDFTYLKVRHRLTASGKTVRRLCRDNITKQRQKLKKLYKKYINREITIEDISQAYGSWKGYAIHRNSIQTVRNMDRLYVSLFNDIPVQCKKNKKYNTT